MRRQIPRDGAERYLTRFLWYPVRIGDDWRWGEKARIRQMRVKGHWETQGFADEELLDRIEGSKYRPGMELANCAEAQKAKAMGFKVEWSLHPQLSHGWIKNPSMDHYSGKYRVAP